MDGAGTVPVGGGQSDGKPWSENCVSNTLFPPQSCALLTLNQSPFNSVCRCPPPLPLWVFAAPMNTQGKSWPQSSELGWSAGGPPWSPLGLAWTPALHQRSAGSLSSAGHMKLPARCRGAGPVQAGVTACGGQVLGALEKGCRSTVNPDVQGLRRAPGPDVSGGTAAVPLTPIHP